MGFFGVVLLVVVMLVGGMAAGFKEMGKGGVSSRNVTETVIQEGGRDKVAHIDLEGVITASAGRGSSSMVEEFNGLMNSALRDGNVKAIVVRINSPGGEVTASDRLHRTIKEANEQKPVVAYLDTIAASGGYYAACGTRHIMAHPTSFTGSIGVIMQSVKYIDLFEKIGVGMETYKSGEMKDLLSGTRPTRDDEMELINDLVGETYDRFLEVVAENRGKPVSELRGSPFTDGRIFSGLQGLKGGMVDSNGFVEDAYDKAAELAGITGPTVVRYRARLNFFDALGPFAEGGGRMEVDLSERLLPRLQSGVPLYLHLDSL